GSLLYLAAYFDLRSEISTHRSLTNWKAAINKQRQCVCFDFLFFAKNKESLAREKKTNTVFG
ncbi:hypothetical protein ACTHUG_11545, partial [Neisseria sp. P0022.S009]|uniref:hypothetical protein n=1 Tax=Neisseria sp. P0022.S009 TaxID=3436834 RepID=UPI003F814743